jgi:hypothetical protein
LNSRAADIPDHGRHDEETRDEQAPMSTDHGRHPDGPDADRTEPSPLAPDRPYVDGTARSPDELRAEAAELADPDRQRVDEAREELAATVSELATRLSPRNQARAAGDTLLGVVRRPQVIAGAATAALLFGLARWRRARRAEG